MKIHDVIQGDEDWHKIRLGRFTASCMDQIISPTGKQSTQVDKYINKLIAERITERSCDPFKGNVHTERGKTLEEEAADYYAMVRNVEPQIIGFCTTDDDLIGCSPDRFIGDDGILEIKTCLPHIMVEQYLKDSLEQDHRPQTQCCLLVTGKSWIDTMLYCPDMKPIIMRSTPKDDYISDMLKFTNEAHTKMTARMAEIMTKGFVS